jgi:uroporphyrinogen-III synthase
MNLENKRVLVTRPKGQMETFAKRLQAAGAIPVPFPVIEIRPVPDTTALDRALRKLACYEWLVFTSVNGVDAVWERLQALELGSIPESTQVAAIGPKTAASLQEHGVQADYVPEEYLAEAILHGLGDVRDRWILLPRADLARDALPRAIMAAGGIAHEITAYRTLPADPDAHGLEALRAGVEVITFTSASTVRNFVATLAAQDLDPLALPGDPLVACIGPITAHAAREAGLSVSVTAQEFTTEGIIEALNNFQQSDNVLDRSRG